MSGHPTIHRFSMMNRLGVSRFVCAVALLAAFAPATAAEVAVDRAHRQFSEELWALHKAGPPSVVIDDEARLVLKRPWETTFSLKGRKIKAKRRADGGGFRFAFALNLPGRMSASKELLIDPRARRDGKWEPVPGLVTAVLKKPKLAMQFELPLPFVPDQLFVTAHPLRLDPVHGEFEVEPTEGASLRFGIGVLEGWQWIGPVKFSVEGCIGTQCSEVFSETIAARGEAAEVVGWLDRQVSLRGFVGQKVKLRFIAVSADGNASNPVAFFSDPVLLQDGRNREAGPNLLLISLDTLGARHLGGYGYARATSPFLDQFFEENGSLFEQCIAASSSTMPSHMSMMTSLTPAVHGARNIKRKPMPAGAATLPRWLRLHGFATAAVTENGAIARSRGFGRGFAVHRENREGESKEHDRTIEKTFNEGLDLIRTLKDQRFFVFLHTYKTHNPYLPPVGYRKRFGNSDPGYKDLVNRVGWAPRFYDREIRYTDDQVRNLLETMRREGLLENTIVVVTSDHGEAFLEHGFLAHGALAYEEVLHVPLLMSGPGIPKGLRIREPVSLLDLMPSVLDLLGVEHPAGLMGRSYRNLLKQNRKKNDWMARPIYSEALVENAVQSHRETKLLQPTYAVREGDFKLIRFRTGTGYRYEMYDLRKDPGEKVNVYQEKNPIAVNLRDRLSGYDAQARALRLELESQGQGKASLAPNPIDTDMLKVLGYLE